MLDYDDIAKEIIASKDGVGMTPPFYAETASTKDDPSWPFWIVRNANCNSLGCFLARDDAENLAAAMNEVHSGSTGDADGDYALSSSSCEAVALNTTEG